MLDHFLGYVRGNGWVGTRNHVAIIPTSVGANHVSTRISKLVSGTIALAHHSGELQVAEDAARTLRILTGVGLNPNVGAVLIVGVNEADEISPERIAQQIRAHQKPAEVLSIEASGGSVRAIEEGVKKAHQLIKEIQGESRRQVGLDKLIIGSKCGGSDATSGIVTNPALGKAVDLLIQAGGTVIFGETTEIIGAEHILVSRAANRAVGQRLLDCVVRWEDAVSRMGVDMRGGNPSPGNIAGGLTTIEEKSLGAISKAGTTPLQGIVEYGQRPEGQGLYFMDSPGNDIECVSGMLSSGVQLVCFTTGRGTPTGSPIAPVMKLCSNPVTSKKMQDNIDFDGSDVLLGNTSLGEAGEAIFERTIRFSSGELVKAEVLGHREFSINRIAVGR